MDNDFVLRVLRVFAPENNDDLWWKAAESGSIEFFVRCSDFFHYASADLEQITPENIAALEQAHADAEAADDDGDIWASHLFAARARKLRPMRLAYSEGWTPELVALFDAAGPERDPKAEDWFTPEHRVENAENAENAEQAARVAQGAEAADGA